MGFDHHNSQPAKTDEMLDLAKAAPCSAALVGSPMLMPLPLHAVAVVNQIEQRRCGWLRPYEREDGESGLNTAKSSSRPRLRLDFRLWRASMRTGLAKTEPTDENTVGFPQIGYLCDVKISILPRSQSELEPTRKPGMTA